MLKWLFERGADYYLHLIQQPLLILEDELTDVHSREWVMANSSS
jgi:hypothetical protein